MESGVHAKRSRDQAVRDDTYLARKEYKVAK
jgi:hypothetical protein